MPPASRVENSGIGHESFKKIFNADGFRRLLQVLNIRSFTEQLQQSGHVVPLTFRRFVRLSVPLQLADDSVLSRRYVDFECVAVTKMLDRGAVHGGDVERALATNECHCAFKTGQACAG